MKRSKGVGEAVSTIIIIVVFSAFFVTYIYMANNNIQASTQLNFEALGLAKLKSTFSLFNQSLGTTWLISTVQAVFITSDESIGCGRTDDPGGPVTVSKPGYWYVGRDDVGRSPDVDDKGIPRTPAAEKYNKAGFNPQLCYPRDNHVIDYIKYVLETRGFLSLASNPVSSEITVNAADVIITMSKKTGSQNADTTIVINLLDNRIESAFRQTIKATYQSGMINRQTENNFSIETSLRQMVASGRNAVDVLLVLGDGRNGGPVDDMSYWSRRPSNKDDYQGQYKSFIENAIRAASSIRPEIATTTELRANGDGNGIISYPRSGLVLHYDTTVTYSDPDRYYYHDQASNEFVKRPIKLTYKAEDYLPALSCVEYQPPAFPADRLPLFSWQNNNDMLCCAGHLFSCGTSIDGLPQSNQIAMGASMTQDSGDQSQCLNTTGGADVICTAAGFTVG